LWPLFTAELWVRLSTTCSLLIPSTSMSLSVMKRETTADINLRYIGIGFRCPLLEVSRTHKSQHTWHVPSTSGATSTSLRPHVHFFGPIYHYTTHFLSTTVTKQTPLALTGLYLLTQSFRHISATFDLVQENFIWHAKLVLVNYIVLIMHLANRNFLCYIKLP
jgi:hypothetical protein